MLRRASVCRSARNAGALSIIPPSRRRNPRKVPIGVKGGVADDARMRFVSSSTDSQSRASIATGVKPISCGERGCGAFRTDRSAEYSPMPSAMDTERGNSHGNAEAST